MKKYGKISVFSVLVALSFPVAAEWGVQGVYVKRVEQFYIGSVSAARVIYEADEDSLLPGFACVPNTMPIPGTTNRYQAAYWNSGANALHQILIGQLLAAQAQELKIDLHFEASGCNQQTTYGIYGLGRRMTGVSVRSD